MTQLYSRFGLPVKIVGKNQLPTGCYLVRLALMATGEKDALNRLLVEPKHDGGILHIDDKVAKGWTHDGDLRAEGGWPTIEPVLKAAPDLLLNPKEAQKICDYLGFIYEHKPRKGAA